MSDPLGLYIHIPFCRSKCDYCDFYSLAGCETRMDDYLRALSAHLTECAPRADGFSVDTVYFGGGTPSYFGEKRLISALKHIRKHYKTAKDAEITLEANPDSVDVKMLTRLRRAGFNRLSLGMQSAHDAQLAALHRPHTFRQVEDAVAAARAAGFGNLSLDLIYGLPGQTMEDWKASLGAAVRLAPEHLSCYGLKVEEGTPLWNRREKEVFPDDDAQAEMYLETVRCLGEAGYRQYEISNFAKPGFESRHNLKYWTLRPYMGFGPGAHADFGGRRYSHIRDLEGYIRGVSDGGRIIDEDEVITRRERGREYVMLGLRTAEGIDKKYFGRFYRMDFAPLAALLEGYAAQGWAVREGDRWRLTPEGFLRSNALLVELLEKIPILPD